jgi:mono/diheme cytochrome c family protein
MSLLRPTVLALLPSVAFAVACSSGSVPTSHATAGDPEPTPTAPRNDDPGPPPGPNLFPPELGPTTIPSTRAPAIFGGTLLLLADGKRAVAADPDRDRIYVVDLVTKQVTATIATGTNTLPFRGVESTPGIVHFTLRGTGEVVTLDASAGTTAWRASACPEPRGIAYDAVKGQVAVACERGDVVSLAATDGAPRATLHTPLTSARDLFVEGDGFWISDFRSARLVLVDANGAVVRSLGSSNLGATTDYAWRVRRVDPTTFVMSHQTTRGQQPIPTATPSGYGSPPPKPNCVPGESLVSVAVSVLRTNAKGETYDVPSGTLPVDVAYSSVTESFSLALAGNSWQPALRKVRSFQRGLTVNFECTPNPPALPGEIVATELLPTGNALVQSREPALLHVVTPQGKPVATIELSAVSRRDTGLILFHASSGRHVACASCHAEGGDDGQTWVFGSKTTTKRRRTPSLRGTVAGTAPYHWDGEEKNLHALFEDVLHHRMDGPTLDDEQTKAFASWLEGLPAPARATTNDPAVARGRDVFAGAGKCASCHGADGAKPSSDFFDVGTGGDFGAPSLVGVGLRTPLMHDGCAPTVADRFVSSCGGAYHGGTLTPSQRADVVAYLQSL